MEKQNKMKTSFWSPNSKSILCYPFVRWTNYILLIIGGSLNSIIIFYYVEMNFQDLDFINPLIFFLIVIEVGVGMGVARWIIIKRVKNTDFFLWDYTERKKRDRYLFYSFFVCGFLSLISVFIISANLMMGWYSIKYYADYFINWNPVFVIVVNSVTSILFIINPIKYVELYYPIFENEIEKAYKIQKKPDRWIDSGKEISSQDEIDEMFYRDFGIHID